MSYRIRPLQPSVQGHPHPNEPAVVKWSAAWGFQPEGGQFIPPVVGPLHPFGEPQLTATHLVRMIYFSYH